VLVRPVKVTLVVLDIPLRTQRLVAVAVAVRVVAVQTATTHTAMAVSVSSTQSLGQLQDRSLGANTGSLVVAVVRRTMVDQVWEVQQAKVAAALLTSPVKRTRAVAAVAVRVVALVLLFSATQVRHSLKAARLQKSVAAPSTRSIRQALLLPQYQPCQQRLII
jgi:hypothetical protein